MKFEQIKLIKRNFERIAPQEEDFATHFYNQLFAQKPTLRLLFPADLTEQKKKLMMTLRTAINTLDRREKLIPVLEELGRKHALYGVRDEHYEAVGATLLLTLGDKLAEEFTVEARQAWTEMFALVADTMKRAAFEMSIASLPKSDLVATDENVNPLKFAGQLAVLIVTYLMLAFNASAQTDAFTYQGRLNDGGTAANGSYQMKFALFDAQNSQVGQTLENQTVNVNGGVFTVELNFGTNAFRGEERFLEISIRRNSQENYVTLAPRQRVTSAPYAIKSFNSDSALTATNSQQLGGIEAGQYIQTTDARLSDEREPKAGSGNYIQNTTAQQLASNFNISGEGKASVFSATTQFNLGADRILSNAGLFNLFVGAGAGAVNTTGDRNTFVGADAGQKNVSGFENSFFGRGAGGNNTTGVKNSFFGRSAGLNTTTGGGNAFFGTETGFANSTGNYNSFFGTESGYNNNADANSFFGSASGRANTTGNSNSFFGTDAGRQNTTAKENSFFGTAAGRENITGSFNSFFGSLTGLNNTTGEKNSFFGTSSGVGNTTGNGNAFFGNNSGFSNAGGNYNSFFGNESGLANQTGNTNSFFGSAAGRSNTIGLNNAFFGADAGRLNQNGQDNSFFGTFSGFNNQSGTLNTFIGISAGGANTTGSNNTMIGANTSVGVGNLSFATAIGANATVLTSNTIVLGRGDGSDKVRIFGLGANGTTQLCRNASNEISTCSITLTNKDGDEISKTLQSQKAQIDVQAEQIKRQQEQIELLKQIVCSQNVDARFCQK